MRSAGKTAGRSRRGILFPGYRLVDAATQAYALTVGILLLVLHDATVPDWKILAAGHGLWILALHGFLRATACRGPGNPPVRRRPVDFLREYYPLLLLPLWFREIGSLNRMLVPEYLDPTLLRWEQAWFGGQASVAWMLRWPSVWVAEFFHTAYFSYYLMIGGTAAWLLARNAAAARHFVTVVCLVFYACYLFYLAVPVVGPRILSLGGVPPEIAAELGLTLPPPVPPGFAAGPMAAVMRFLYRYFETAGAAFPSSHVVVALVTLRFTWRYLPRLRVIHSLAVTALAASTVYCRYHYVVDVLAALVLTPPLLAGAEILWRRWGEAEAPDPVPSGQSAGTGRS